MGESELCVDTSHGSYTLRIIWVLCFPFVSCHCFPFSWVNTNLCSRPIFVFTYRITQALAHYARVYYVCVCRYCARPPVEHVREREPVPWWAPLSFFFTRREIEKSERARERVLWGKVPRHLHLSIISASSLFSGPFPSVPACLHVCVLCVVSGFLEVAAIVSVPDAYAYLCFLYPLLCLCCYLCLWRRHLHSHSPI